MGNPGRKRSGTADRSGSDGVYESVGTVVAFGFMKGDARREVQEVVPALWVAESRCKKRKGTVDNGIGIIR